MASPSAAEVRTQISAAAKLLEELRKYAHVNAQNFLSHEDAFVQALETDYGAEALAALSGIRASLASAIRGGSSLVMPLLLTYSKALGVPETDLDGMIDRLFEAMHAGSESVLSRQFTFGSPAAGGANAGNGELVRLTVDADGYDIEAAHAETKTWRCEGDEHSGGREHNELFIVRGEDIERDALRLTGSALRARVKVLSAEDSKLRNPSFSDARTSGGSLSEFPGWTVGAVANFESVTTDYYKDFKGETTPKCLRFKVDDSIEQNLAVRRADIDVGVPMFLQVAFKREAACNGTLTLTLGSQTESVVLAAQSGWTILRLTPGTKCWFPNWNQEDPVVKIALAGRTTGTLLVDDVVFAPWGRLDGTWWALVGGSTPFLYGDEFTALDTEVGSVLQHWFWRLFGRYLPHSLAPTWVDP
jgi:hypothetical protein